MRNIKFRVWSNDLNKMVYPNERGWFEKCFIGNNLATQDCQLGVAMDLNGTKLEVMQSTGLQDNNGNEIYEGDILKVPVDGNKELHGNHSLQEVLYKKGAYITSHLVSEKGQILPRGYTAGFLLDHYDFDNKSFLFNENPYMGTDIEVVGNIFEDKDFHKLF